MTCSPGAVPSGSALTAQLLPRQRLRRAKRSFATRRISLTRAETLITGGIVPRAGDLVLAEVTDLGQHRRLELATGRRAELYEGDEVLVLYGNRYATDQFEARVPETLGACHLVAGGGIASRVVSKAQRMKAATRIMPLGVIGDRDARPLSSHAFGLAPCAGTRRAPRVIAVVGSAMNAGKTTTMAALVHGAVRLGWQVAAIKATGTGSGGDTWKYADAGASLVMDFTDAGFATTHCAEPRALETATALLTGHAAEQGADLTLIEIADGVLFEETAKLVRSRTFRDLVDGVVFAASDPMSALAGETWLARAGLPVLGLAGAFTQSPLAIAEVERLSSLPVLSAETMLSGEALKTISADLRRSRVA